MTQTAGPYELKELLGQGASGNVYRGEHLLLRRAAAVKVLTDDHDPLAVGRFIDEARALARLSHPGLVQLFDCALLPSGGAFLAMELLEGELLAERLARSGPLPLETIVSLIRQLAEALEVVHDAGLVHRDIKPSNLFLVEDQGQLKIKLLDFGVAKHGSTGRSRTEPGMLLGTPCYMSPEQCRGAPNIDRRADVYALGALLYEMVSGAPPFVGDKLPEIIEQHLYHSPPPLCGRVPGLPEAVGEVAARALAKSPDDRFSCALALAVALEGALSSGPSTDQMSAVEMRALKPRVTQPYSARVIQKPPPPPKPALPTTAVVPVVAQPLPRPTVITRRARRPGRGWMLSGALVILGLVVGVAAWLAVVSERSHVTFAPPAPSVAMPAIVPPSSGKPDAEVAPPSEPPARHLHRQVQPRIAPVAVQPGSPQRASQVGLLNPFE